MATVASKPSRVVTAAWSIRAQHHGTSAPYGAWRESWGIVALYDVSWWYTHPFKTNMKSLILEVLEDDFPVQRADFQVVATSFRGSICWWKRGRNWEKLGDDALGVPGGKIGFCGMWFYCSSFSGKKIRVFGETCEFPFRFKLQTTNQNAFLQWKLQRNPSKLSSQLMGTRDFQDEIRRIYISICKLQLNCGSV